MKRTFRYVVAAAIAAASVPLIQLAASGSELAPVGFVRTYPVLHGIGVNWAIVGADGYQVERRISSTAEWTAVSEVLGGGVMTWVDTTAPAGSTVEYRVVAQTPDGPTEPSPVVQGTRPASDPVVGSVDVLGLDADPGSSDTVFTDRIAGPVTDGSRLGGVRRLTANGLRIDVPELLTPGEYTLDPERVDRSVLLAEEESGCEPIGTLTVTEIAYSDDFSRIATMTADIVAVCDGDRMFAQTRVKSPAEVAAISVSPVRLNAGRVPVGTTSATRTITFSNVGTAKVDVDHAAVSGDAADDWTIVHDRCRGSLPVKGTCSVDVAVSPSSSGLRTAKLTIADSTTRGNHSARLAVTGLSVPDAPANVRVVGTFTGADLSWDPPVDDGSSEVTGYVIHRYVNGTDTTFTQYNRSGERFIWYDTPRVPGATYAVAAVNAIGEGAHSAPQAVKSPRDAVAVLLPSFGVSQFSQPDGSQYVPVVATGYPTADASDVTTSPDGRQLAWVNATTLWTVRAESPAEGTAVKVAAAEYMSSPSWSPDGTRIAFAFRDGEDSCVSIASATGGSVVKVRCGVSEPSWLPDARSIVVNSPTGLQRIEAGAGGRILKTYSDTAETSVPQVSPDGRWIAYQGWGPQGRQIIVVSTAGGERHFGPSIMIRGRFSWKPNASDLVFAITQERVATMSVRPDGTFGEVVDVAYLPDQWLGGAAWQGLGLMIRPTASMTGAATTFQFDASALLSGTQITCQIDSGTPTQCSSPFTVRGLTTGSHALRVTAVEPDGRRVVASRWFSTDATAPVTTITGPTFATTLDPRATVTYTGSDNTGVASYDVRYRTAPYSGTFGAFSQPWSGTKARSVSLSIAPGYEYCFSARARDVFGNVGAWSAERCFSRPMDDRSLTAATTGWTRASWSAFYLSTATHSTRYGASLTRVVQGKRFYLLATKCPTCGTASVYLGGRYLTAVSLYSATTQRQVLIPLPAQSSVFSGTLTITTRSSGKLVQIDGLGVRRT